MEKEILYSNHLDQLEQATPSADRVKGLQEALSEAFDGYIVERTVGFIQFDQVSVEELAKAFYNHPIMVKSVLASVNIASRAVARDLRISLDTYKTNISKEIAAALAGYIKPMLPKELAIPSLIELDRYFWTDKEMRAAKGNWERRITQFLNDNSEIVFKKRKFKHNNESYELDAAYPATSNTIEFGIDVKRIESPRDIHKRADEIINKASKFKDTFPEGKFYAVIYYPFPSEHQNVKSRLQSANIEGVYFAGETDTSIKMSVEYLLGSMGKLK